MKKKKKKVRNKKLPSLLESDEYEVEHIKSS